MRKKLFYLGLLVFLSSYLVIIWIAVLEDKGKEKRLNSNIIVDEKYRNHYIGEKMLDYLSDSEMPGEDIAIYLLESNFGYKTFPYNYTNDNFEKLKEKWRRNNYWNEFSKYTKGIWNEIKYFPVAELIGKENYRVNYINSWMFDRTYGGQRGHEGTDIMAEKNERGLYPVLSMTDGVITKKGWLEKGGYRIGIENNAGVYFYYAHLDSYADVEIGDQVKAGDIIGFMGDSGYGAEGTIGKFDVHLHLGIYVYLDEEEISINPYWILRYIENRKVKCYTKE